MSLVTQGKLDLSRLTLYFNFITILHPLNFRSLKSLKTSFQRSLLFYELYDVLNKFCIKLDKLTQDFEEIAKILIRIYHNRGLLYKLDMGLPLIFYLILI